ncbi:MAG: exodeoxyribonuclease VII small subunit [Bacteroidia bacterium]|nr:exodeoxyribonuclease VII small subunit [Bacteroidia bacterium]
MKKILSYKQAVTEIEEIMSKIENEELDIDELSEYVKRVSVLIRFCREKLRNTGEEVGKIMKEMED